MTNICGVDISKSFLDAAIVPGNIMQRFDNNPAGIEALAGFCHDHQAGLAVMEATGGFERKAFEGLWRAGIESAIVNAAHVRSYARSMGALEKTDRLDACMIARYARSAEIVSSPPKSKDQQRLTALVRRLSQLTRDISAHRLRRRQAEDGMIADGLDAILSLMEKHAKSLEGEIASLIDDDPVWSKLGEAITSVKGVAARTLACIMAELPEIGTVSGKAIAKLAGIAPLANDSGKKTGQRHIKAGRAPVRHILYLIGELASRYNENLREFQQKLQSKGKQPKVIRIALARKLLVILNAKARDARAEMKIAA
jgi:transposase